jgi:antitoxin ChpS
MHMRAHIRKIGNSVGTIIPIQLLKKLDLAEGDKIEITEKAGHLIIQPVHERPKYSLAELLKKCDPSAPQHSDIGAWEQADAIGLER